MPYVLKEQIQSAKQIDLLTYLQRYEPQELVHIRGDVYCTRTHDSLKISHGKWCWWSHHMGGRSALDYLIKVKGMDFTDAVTLLCSDDMRIVPAFTPYQRPKFPKRFGLPEVNADNDRVVNYLKKRGIDIEIISYCIETGRLYQSKEYSNAVFVGFDLKEMPRYAMLRGTSMNSSYMLDIPGSDKRHCFCIMADCQCDSVYLFESAIDLLSYATLLKLEGQNWRDVNYLSLGGIYLPRINISETALPLALAQYLEEHPETKKINLCLDNDDAGREAAQAIVSTLGDNYEAESRPPVKGKDYNDQLRIKRDSQNRHVNSMAR